MLDVLTANFNNCIYFNKIWIEENMCENIFKKTVADSEPVTAKRTSAFYIDI